MMESFATTVKSLRLSFIVTKLSVLDIYKGPGYAARSTDKWKNF